MKQTLLILILLLTLAFSLNAGEITVSSYDNQIQLLDSNPEHLVMQLTLGHFTAEPVNINENTWNLLSLKKEGLTLEAGFPQLPILARSVIIPNTANMELSVIDTEYVEMTLPVAPSKGNLTRDINPETVPYSFADFYFGNEFWPEEHSYLTEPFILRDYRGITVRFQPFVYYPATQTLRIYTKLTVALNANGTDLTNSLPVPKTSYAEEFAPIYENMFLNFNEAKYPSLAEQGRILAIKNSMFDTVMQPWVDWKCQNGYRVDVVDVSVAGPTANQIKNYIQNQYDLNDGLMFVQIFGDAPQVPTLTASGGGSDPSYSLLAGTDSYPDIYVGRFSAQTVAEMETQIIRSVYYEKEIQAGSQWVQRAMGIASNQGGGSQGDMGESDQQHQENIRTDLLNYGYLSVDQIYESMGATAAQVSTNLNQGRGFINYTGHGTDTYWVTTGFSNTHVNALTNDYMLPFIQSVACVNGNFVSMTCFAEAWLRSINESTNAPAGAIGFYGSSINQLWNPPMRAQDETVDLLVAEQKHTMGGLFYNGSSKMIEVYDQNGISTFLTWNIFGDCSLMVRSKDPQPITANYTPILFIGMNTFTVSTIPGARVTLYSSGTIYATGIADANGDINLTLENPPLEPMDLTLTITAFNKVTYLDTIQVLPASGPYLIVVDMVVTDNNNNLPEYGELITINLTLNNVGNDAATNSIVSIQTEDPYLTIINGTENIPDIAANSIGGTVNGLTIQVASNVPDQHSASIHIITSCDDGTYEYDRNLILNAPVFTWEGLIIQDFLGNNNGVLDPGESVTLCFPITNSGHSQANNITSALAIMGGMNVMEPMDDTFPSLAPEEQCQITYYVTISSQVSEGTNLTLTAMLFAGDYSSVQNYPITVGLLKENFETNFSGFNWQFNGGNWTIDHTSYNNSHSAKSALITHNQTTSISVTLNCPVAGTISFWKKVSSELNYDYLRFAINDVVRNQWSGTSDIWSQVFFEVPAGQNTFVWSYSKDSGTSSGSDCAWIDDIIFPSSGTIIGTPIISVDSLLIDFGVVPLGQIAQSSFTINNNGDAVLIGTVQVSPPFAVFQGNGSPGFAINIIVPAQSFLGFNVTFTPVDTLTYHSTMQIETDDPVNPVIVVQLNGKGNVVSNDDPILPVVTELKSNFPNPFNPSTTIAYSIKETTAVRIEIFNVKGQLVRTLVNEVKTAGNYKIDFDGLDNNHRQLASGIYFCRMQAGNYSKTHKMLMLK
ncbi:MAG: C25 family cysteine peptidase [Candidatus Cloacimonadaceae bacterium]